jgi:hypothetical protein
MSLFSPKPPKPPPPPPPPPTRADAQADIMRDRPPPLGNFVATGSTGGLQRKARTVKSSLLGGV